MHRASPARRWPVLLSVLVALAPAWTAPAQAAPTRTDCVERASSARLVLVLEDAEAAFARLDLEGFQAATDEAATLVPCLEATLSREQAARYHRVQGLRAWLVRDLDRSRLAFLAARAIQPDWRFPVELVPEDHPTREAYMALPLEELVTAPVDVPDGARLVVDGRVSTLRPVNLPAVLQLQDELGGLRWSVYAGPGEALPDWPQDLAAGRDRHPWRIPLVAGSAGSAALSGVLVALAAGSAARYHDADTPVEALDGLRTRTNGLLVASAAAGGLALGAGVGAAWSFR